MVACALTLLTLIPLALTAAPASAGDPPPEPCLIGTVPHEIRFEVEALTELDEFTLDPVPEMFMHIFVDGVFLCEVDGANGWAFDGSCTVDIEEPYNLTRIRFLLWDSDPPLDDYTVDIGPGASLDFQFIYDPQCGTVEEVPGFPLVGCPIDNTLAECRGKRTVEGSEGRLSFEIVPVDGIPVAANSLSVMNMETIQVFPNPSALVADRQTVVRLDIGSSHPVDKTANVAVQVRDRADNLFTDVREITIPACSVNREEVFFGPEWDGPGTETGFRPQTGFGNFFLVGAEVDPLADCGPGADPPCVDDPQLGLDCRIVDGSVIETELGLRPGKELDVFYQPFLSRSKVICNTSVEEGLPPGAATSTQPLLEDLFPASAINSSTSSLRVAWPLPAGEPTLDIVDLFDPRPGLALLELAGAIAGLDRWMLVTYQGGLSCNWPSLDLSDAPGAAAGALSRAALAEPRNDGLDFPEVVAHELAHTWGMAESPCPIEDDLFGGIKCEDEYNYPPESIVAGPRGVRAEGFQVLRWVPGEASNVRDMDGRACVMGASSPGAPNAWIDRWDYEKVLENVTDTSTPGPALFLRTRLTPGFGGTFQTRDVSRISAVPTQALDSFSGRSPAAHTTSLRLKRADGSVIDTVSFTLENVDLDMDGVNESFAGLHGMGVLDFLDASWIIALPTDATTIELVRRAPTGPTTFTETVTDVLTLESPPLSLTLLAPITIFEARAFEWYRFDWEFSFPGPAPVAPGGEEEIAPSVSAGEEPHGELRRRDGLQELAPDGSAAEQGETGATPAGTTDPGAVVPTKSYVFVTEDDGDSWVPVGVYLDGTSFDWQAPRDGRFGVRVFATSGFETSEQFPLTDIDKDGCADQFDPDPDQFDLDGGDLDGVAQICDRCPNDYDPLQGDRDQDLIGDACDICPGAFDPQQADTDLDGAGDACDCEAFDATTFAAPGAVTGLVASSAGNGSVKLDWSSLADTSGTSVVYDVVSGSLSDLRNNASFANATCGLMAVPDPTVTIGGVPAPGDGEWYLVRGQNSCGFSTFDGGGAGQVASRDAEIEAATLSCGVCLHDRCTEGSPLNPGCGSCIDQICAADPFCCTNAWDQFCVNQVRSVCNILDCPQEVGNCVHSQCELGLPLTSGCDAAYSNCVADICAVDPFCCSNTWDQLCVDQVESVCGLTCE